MEGGLASQEEARTRNYRLRGILLAMLGVSVRDCVVYTIFFTYTCSSRLLEYVFIFCLRKGLWM